MFEGLFLFFRDLAISLIEPGLKMVLTKIILSRLNSRLQNLGKYFLRALFAYICLEEEIVSYTLINLKNEKKNFIFV